MPSVTNLLRNWQHFSLQIFLHIIPQILFHSNKLLCNGNTFGRRIFALVHGFCDRLGSHVAAIHDDLNRLFILIFSGHHFYTCRHPRKCGYHNTRFFLRLACAKKYFGNFLFQFLVLWTGFFNRCCDFGICHMMLYLFHALNSHLASDTAFF